MRSDRGTASPTGDGCGVPRYGEGAVVSTPITAAERHKRMPARGHAASFVLGAARIEAEEADDWRDSSLADGYRAQALAPLSGEMIVHGAGGELVPTDSGKGAAEWRLLDTVDNPNYVTADASRGRLDLAQQAGALEEALDAADTIEARDSLERMLAHQLATLHVSAMKMSADLNRRLDYLANVRGEESERVNIQATRLANAVGRLMSTYQQGMMTLQRFRSGGQQTVVVQHVQANQGSRVVVAGKVGREGGVQPGGRSGNDQGTPSAVPLRTSRRCERCPALRSTASGRRLLSRPCDAERAMRTVDLAPDLARQRDWSGRAGRTGSMGTTLWRRGECGEMHASSIACFGS